MAWQFWAVIFVVVVFVLWVVWGRKTPNPTPPSDVVNGIAPILEAIRQPPAERFQPIPGQIEGVRGPSPIIRVSPLLVPSPGLQGEIVPLPPVEVIQSIVTEETKFHRRKQFGSVGEDLTRQAFEAILGRQVQCNIRPPHLRNPETGRNLEYDCYDPVNRIAIEYNGIQHYTFPNKFHRTFKEFENQQYRDNLKVRLSEENGITLIRVPYTVDTCRPDPSEPSGYKYDPHITKEQRYERIHRYLSNLLRCNYQKCTITPPPPGVGSPRNQHQLIWEQMDR